MREDICTIPVSEVFEEKDGCPMCRMYDTAEDRIITYIMGDAMMEPDVRIETNKKGFCEDHYNKMLKRKGRLQLALMLETHLKEKNKEIFDKKLFNSNDKKVKKAQNLNDSCFICDKIDFGVKRMTETIYKTYEKEKDFRNLFDTQPQFCLKHYNMLIKNADKKKMPKYYGEFCSSLTRITGDYMKSLCSDIESYCKMYDYRSTEDKKNCSNEVKTAVERTVAFLNGETFKE